MSRKIDSKIEKAVEKFVAEKIKDIKSVDDIFIGHNFEIDKSLYADEMESYEKLYTFKKILQLTINAAYNYEYYKDFKFKINSDENSSYDFLESFDDTDASQELWKCSAKPENSVIVAMLSDYAICFLSIKINEDYKEQIEFNECPFCNTIFECNDDCCSVCEASIADMRKNVADKIHKQKVNKDVIVDNRPNYDNKESDEDESNNSHVGRHNERRKDLPLNVNYDINQKWKCGQCGLLNEYSCGNCGACEDVYGNGYWTCGNCNKENKCDEEECRYCQERNYNIEHMAPNVNANRDIGDNPAQFHRQSDKIATAPVAKQWDHRNWTCGGCGLLNDYVSRICDACSKVYNDGRWICGECTTENSCAEDVCNVCSMRNAMLMNVYPANYPFEQNVNPNRDIGQFPQQQDYNKITGSPITEYQWDHRKWKCGYCELLNDYFSKSCIACSKVYNDGRWICGECTTENSCAQDVCHMCGVKNNNVRLLNNVDKKSDDPGTNIGSNVNYGALDDVERCNRSQGGKIHAPVRELIKVINKWKCGGCGFLNEYLYANCRACGGLYKDGIWTCAYCSMECSCTVKECDTCHRRNDNIKTVDNVNQGIVVGESNRNIGNTYGSDYNVNILYDAHIPDDEWMCRACKVRHTYMQLSCSACYRGRHSHGLWTCAKCTHVNTCDKHKCGVCYTINVYLVKNYCQSCNKNIVNNGAERCVQCTKDMDIQWICRFHHFSNVKNNGKDYYCQKCGLCRYSLRDDQRKQWFNGRERIVWVCRMCYLSNELTKDRCGGILRFCLQTRADNILDTNARINYV